MVLTVNWLDKQERMQLLLAESKKLKEFIKALL